MHYSGKLEPARDKSLGLFGAVSSPIIDRLRWSEKRGFAFVNRFTPPDNRYNPSLAPS